MICLDRVELGLHRSRITLDHGVDDPFLGRVVVVERAFGDARGERDRVHRSFFEPFLDKQVDRRVEDGVAGLQRFAVAVVHWAPGKLR